MESCGPRPIFRRFILTTSIRGARNTLEAESRTLRVFWSVFILLSLSGVITTSFFCIQSYLTFDTVVQRNHLPFRQSYFPDVTICSDGLFGHTRDAHMLLAHPLAYKRYVNALAQDAMARDDYEAIESLMTLKSTVMYNVNNNDIIDPLVNSFIQRTKSVEFKKAIKRKLRSIMCSAQSQTKTNDCIMRTFTDFRFRNCITFEMPERSDDNMKQQQMEIIIPTVTLKAPVEFAADLLHLKPLLGRFVFVFLHEVGTLPPRVPTTFVPANSYSSALINFDATLVDEISTPHFRCRKVDEVLRVPHAGRNVVEDELVCTQKALQDRVRSRCGCEWWGPPLGANWAAKDRRPAFCGTLRARNVTAVVQELQCMQQEEARLEADKDSDSADLRHCMQPCSRLEYGSPRVFLDSMDFFKYREMLNEYRALIWSESMLQQCSESGSKSEKCQNIAWLVSNLMRQVETTDSWPPTANSSMLKMKHRKTMNAKRNEQLKNWLKVLPEKDSRMLWWKAFPNGTDFNLDASTDFNLLFQRLILRPGSWEVQVDKHTLVRTKWMTLGQVGGAASFLAGLSLTVLAELVDACCYLRSHRRRRDEVSATSAARGTDNEVSTMEKEDLNRGYWSVPRAESPL